MEVERRQGALWRRLRLWAARIGSELDAATRPRWKAPRNVYVRGGTANRLIARRGQD